MSTEIIGVRCLICDFVKDSSIVEHLRHSHKLTVKQYRDQFGENSKVKSVSYSSRVSEQFKQVWKDQEFHDKMSRIRKITHNTPEFHDKQSKKLKEFYANGGKVWSDGLTKNDHPSIASTGKKNSEHLFGRTKETYENLRMNSERMKRCNYRTDARKLWSKEKLNDWKQKISITISQKYATGEIIASKNRFHTGWYESIGDERYYFSSGWERDFMMFLDSKNITWTNKHGIVIPYKLNNQTRRYVPDFLINLGKRKIILEIKGRFEIEELNVKISAARAKFGDDYYIAFSLKESQDIINEIIENQKD